MPTIHPTAIVHRDARLDDVEVGPYCVVEDGVTIGAGSVLRAHSAVRRHTSLGQRNLVESFTVLGGEPQDLRFDPATVSFLRIGDDNIFREGVTISRATGQGLATTVGSRTYWMTGAHAGHNAVVEDECILVNGAVLAGHTVLGRRAVLSAHIGVHQFCWIGEGAMGQGNSAVTMHVPPYSLFASVNRVVGLNSVGLRRWPGLTEKDRQQVKEAFALTYRRGMPLREALACMDERAEWGTAAHAFREFIRRVASASHPHDRGLCPLRRRNRFGNG